MIGIPNDFGRLIRCLTDYRINPANPLALALRCTDAMDTPKSQHQAVVDWSFKHSTLRGELAMETRMKMTALSHISGILCDDCRTSSRSHRLYPQISRRRLLH